MSDVLGLRVLASIAVIGSCQCRMFCRQCDVYIHEVDQEKI